MFLINVAMSIINSLASLSVVMGLKDRPLDSRVICYLMRGLPVRFTTFSLAQENQSGMTHLYVQCVCLFLSFFDFLFLFLLVPEEEEEEVFTFSVSGSEDPSAVLSL